MARKKNGNNEETEMATTDEYEDVSDVADHDATAGETWDDVVPPLPLPNIRFTWQGVAATYSPPDEDNPDKRYAFACKVLEPVGDVDESELPEDWRATKVWVRFDIPGRFGNSLFDVKQFLQSVGFDMTGLTHADNEKMLKEEFKKQKPVFEATVQRWSRVNKSTGMQQWGLNLRKFSLPKSEGFEEEAA